jgi:hypothetical protein
MMAPQAAIQPHTQPAASRKASPCPSELEEVEGSRNSDEKRILAPWWSAGGADGLRELRVAAQQTDLSQPPLELSVEDIGPIVGSGRATQPELPANG